MQLSRRDVLAGIAVTAAAAAIPLSAPPAAEPVLVGLDLGSQPSTTAWWGYSINDDFFHGPFDSREQALAEAQSDYPDEPCSTARCIPHEMEAPDLREICVLWLCDGCTEDSLFGAIKWRFDGANEDHDYDGEVGDALASADWKPLLADLTDVFVVTLFRHGRPDLIPAVVAGGRVDQPLVPDDLDPLLVALETDDRFDTDLTAAAEAWMVAQKLKDAPRRVDLVDEKSHPVLELEAS